MKLKDTALLRQQAFNDDVALLLVQAEEARDGRVSELSENV
jgi:hypothetical protein